MRRVLLIVGLVTSVGCASLRQANGSLNIVALVADAQWGLLAACQQQWVPPDGCLIGTDALTTAAAIAAKNGPGTQAAVRQSLQDALAKLPADSRVRPYLLYLVAALA